MQLAGSASCITAIPTHKKGLEVAGSLISTGNNAFSHGPLRLLTGEIGRPVNEHLLSATQNACFNFTQPYEADSILLGS